MKFISLALHACGHALFFSHFKYFRAHIITFGEREQEREKERVADKSLSCASKVTADALWAAVLRTALYPAPAHASLPEQSFFCICSLLAFRSFSFALRAALCVYDCVYFVITSFTMSTKIHYIY